MARTKQASKWKTGAKQAPKRKSGNTALPVLGAAGISLAMAGGASATPPAAHLPSQDAGSRITLGEEEISDVSLATFYVFDKENESELDQDLILAKAGGCGGGCKGGGGGGGCKCGGGGGGCKCGGAGVGCKCGGGCGGCGRGCGCGGGVWIGGCLGCGGGCGTCWQWSPFYGRWIWRCY
jgi:hypothetical protein